MATLVLADGHRYNIYSMKVDLCFKKNAVEAAMYPEESRYLRIEFKNGAAVVPDKPDILEAIENSEEFKKKIIAYVPSIEEIKTNEIEILKKEREETMNKILEIDSKIESLDSKKTKTETKSQAKSSQKEEKEETELKK